MLSGCVRDNWYCVPVLRFASRNFVIPFFLTFKKFNSLDKKVIAHCMDIPLKNQTTTCFEPVVLNCPKGKFNDLATLFLVPQEDAIRFNKP